MDSIPGASSPASSITVTKPAKQKFITLNRIEKDFYVLNKT